VERNFPGADKYFAHPLPYLGQQGLLTTIGLQRLCVLINSIFSDLFKPAYGISWLFVLGVCTWAPQIININGLKGHIQERLRLYEQHANRRRNQNNGNPNAEQSFLISAFNRLKFSCNSNLNMTHARQPMNR
jgi:hypothetical protein